MTNLSDVNTGIHKNHSLLLPQAPLVLNFSPLTWRPPAGTRRLFSDPPPSPLGDIGFILSLLFFFTLWFLFVFTLWLLFVFTLWLLFVFTRWLLFVFTRWLLFVCLGGGLM
ncbi:hypothetical protein EYF80_043237 [Liparis tanakae]|uniref:Uncharacterized protein n=1 Tax=Liparis tanakae TaxID=230148 RepID=A0A4Z2G0Y5_9TELE|nr:hypothetical protein EYF80_043237 [Liparis tanakae]